MTESPDRRGILFVDDDPGLIAGLRNAFRSERSRWDVRFATGGAEALDLLAAAPADVVVTDMRMPVMDGLQLLGRVQSLFPDTVRVVLSGQADLPQVTRASSLAHQYLLKPCDTDSLRAAIDRACSLRTLLASPELRRVVGALGSLPSAPGVGAELAWALEGPEPDMARVASLVEGDAALASRVLQLVNSPCYGPPRRILDVSAALERLGVATLRHLAFTLDVRAAFPIRSLPARALEDLERHSRLTARIARQLVDDPREADAAFLGGLLHDCGKLVLLDRLPEVFREAVARARRSGRPVQEEERALLGVGHAEIGAYLLGLWGLPDPVVEAVAFHHDVPHVGHRPIGPVAAVAAASFLADAAAPGPLAPLDPVTDPSLLEVLSLERSPEWRLLAQREARALGA